MHRTRFNVSRLLVTAPLIVTLVIIAWMPAFAQPATPESKADRDARMHWWRDARFGMFIHWGVYSIPARGEWVMYNEKIPIPEYEKFPPQFNPVRFDAKEWVRIAKAAGVRYIVITSKHHDGFCMWDSKVSTYDIMDATPFKRDVLKELADACKGSGIRLCFYHSIMDWHHPDARGDRFPIYRDKYLKPQLKELITNYGPLGVLWFDGQWIAEWDEDQGRELYAELRALQPDLIMNNRIGKGRNDILGENTGAAMVGDFGTPEQYIPSDELVDVDWESCMTMNDHWGYAAKDTNWKSTKVLIRNLVDIASKGGNYLLNVGPTSLGEIPKESDRRLREMGDWLSVNGESIYGTIGSPFESTPWGRCTMKSAPGGKTRLFLHIFDWPRDGKLAIPGLGSQPDAAVLLASSAAGLPIQRLRDTLVITLPAQPPDTLDPVVALEVPGTVLTYHPPRTSHPAPVFIDKATVTLRVPSDKLEIRYTLDGSVPGEKSPRYAAPITLNASTTVKAVTFHQGKPVSAVVERQFTKVTPRPAATVAQSAPGLKYEYFEGDWNVLPGFDSLKSLATGTAETVGIGMKRRDERFGLRFTGYLTVLQDGVYQIGLNSDDGSRFWIGSDLVIDNDSLHSATEKRAYVALARGAHPITITYFNNQWEGELGVRLASEGKPLEPIPANQFSHTP